MTEHVHELVLLGNDGWPGVEIICNDLDCDYKLSVSDAESRLNEYETLKEAFTIAVHLLGHGDFKNGNTGPNGLIDEGEVYAGRLVDKIQLLVPQLYADTLEGK